MAQSLGLDESDILSLISGRVPLYTWAAHLMVRVRNAGTVDKARPQADRLLAVLKRAQAEGCYIYAFDDHAPETAFARFFNPTVGLWEDAATGTAAGPLAAYLASEAGLSTMRAITRHKNGPPKHIASSHNPRSRIVRRRHRCVARRTASTRREKWTSIRSTPGSPPSYGFDD